MLEILPEQEGIRTKPLKFLGLYAWKTGESRTAKANR
jgi:hypothetical protein